MKTDLITEGLFTQLEGILCPWLGPVCQWTPSNPADLFTTTTEIRGRGFSRLTWQTKYGDPDWILPRWRTASGITCPRCRNEIQALKHWHRIDEKTFTDGPYVFCKCVRLQPSRLPSLEFFTENWTTVLEALTCLEQLAEQSARELQCHPYDYAHV
jgi:hypothetical protein